MQNGKARSTTYTTETYKQYRKDIARQLKGKLRPIHADYEFGILLEIQSVNRRVGDNDNVAKGIHDALEDGKFISNDRYATQTFQIKTFGHDENRCIVHLWEIDYTQARRLELHRLKLMNKNDDVIITKELLERDKKLRKVK